MSDNQQTLSSEFTFEGKGLHLGEPCSVTVHPAEPGTGFRLRVGDTTAAVDPKTADGTRHRTILSCGDDEVHTVEHLCAALWGMGVDNAEIEVAGGEVPGVDGSARPFADKVLEVGLTEQGAAREVFRPRQPICAGFGSSCITAYPTKKPGLRVTYILDYPESSLAQGMAEFDITPETMLEGLSPCRTFVMKCHAQAMLDAGLGQGANTENTIVLDGETVVENQLRFDDECARHKVLDVVGDLATLGLRFGMHVVAYKSGHALNLRLAQLLAEEHFNQTHPRGLLDVSDIERYIPHRHPFLLVDRVVAMTPRVHIRAYKNVTRNEDFFNGHFPGQPIMPGVLQVEALAQTGGVLLMQEQEYQGKLAVLMGVDEVKYRRPVVPGDRLEFDVTIERIRGRIGVVSAVASVDGEVTTQCTIKFALVDPEQYT